MQKIFMFVAGNERGGAASHITTLAEAIVHNGMQEMYTFLSLGAGPLYDSLHAIGVPMKQLTGSPVRIVRLIAEELKRAEGSILHAHGPRLNVIASFAAGRARRPWTSTIHSNPKLDFMASRMKTAILPKLHIQRLSTAIGLFVISRTFADLLPVRTIAFVPNAIEPPKMRMTREEARKDLRSRLKLSETTKLVGLAARFDPVKDIPTLCRAVARIEDPDVHLVLAGDGPLRGELQRLVQDLKIASRTHFLGFISEMGDFYSALDVHVLPSMSEGTGLSLLEAGACGIPNVGSDIPGIRQVIHPEETGLCFTVGKDDELASQIERLLGHRELRQRLAQCFMTHVLPHFEPDKMLEAYQRGYRLFQQHALERKYRNV